MRSDLQAAADTGAFIGPFGKALAAVETLLQPGEAVAAASTCRYMKNNCVAVVTNRRVILASAGLFPARKTSSLLLSAVTGVERGGNKLTIRSTSGDVRLESVTSGHLIEQAINEGGVTPAAPVDPATETKPVNKVEAAHEDALAQIGGMLDRGEITPEEYAERRAKIQKIIGKLG
ncbi:hypothetical protein GCM10027294_53030 [Marinactinospora endophytica]